MPIRSHLVMAMAAALLVIGCGGPAAHEPPAPAGSPGPDDDLEQIVEEAAASGLIEGAPGDAGDPTGLRISAHDQLEIVVFDAAELSGSVRVSSQGDIVLPLLGVIPAAGSTTEELATALEERLEEKYMRDPHVTVQLSETLDRFVYVLGEVNDPGAVPFHAGDRLTVLQAVAMGGGPASLAARDRAVLIRTDSSGERVHLPVDLDRAVAGSALDQPMLPNDILFVPRSTTRSVLRGAFNAFTRLITLRAIF